jgi:uroporphyrinogen decarboxylase
MRDLFVRAARGERTERPPVWLMRQAGRHLPEYREVREEYSFVEAVSTPEVAAELSLQPYERYGVDGVVMFSDILVALEPLGIDYRIESGVGPVIDDPIDTPEAVRALVDREPDPIPESLDYVGDLLEILDSRLDDAATIGFAGGPFTLASYAVAGGSTRSHLPLRRLAATHPDLFASLLETFATVVRDFLAYQIAAGADVVQLFDTYASALPPATYREVLVPLHRRILASLDAPSIVFVRNMAGRLGALSETGADVLGLDWSVEIDSARRTLGDRPVQGNLDPSTLFADPETVRERTREIIDAAGPSGHVLNLGHGVDRNTPIAGVEAFVETAKSIDR